MGFKLWMVIEVWSVVSHTQRISLCLSIDFPPILRKGKPGLMVWAERGDANAYSQVCSHHFTNADSFKTPNLTLGKWFTLPKKSWTAKAQRARKRNITQKLAELSSHDGSSTPVSTCIPATRSIDDDGSNSEADPPPMIVPIGGPLITNYLFHEITDYLVHEFQTDDTDLDSVISAQ